MGKTVKKLHSQRRHHERVAVSVLPETREQVYARVYKGVSVECVCGKTLNLEELATGPYPFRCPSCGKRDMKRLRPSVWESLPMSLCFALAILVEGRPSVMWRGFVSCRALVGSSTAARCMSRTVIRRSETMGKCMQCMTTYAFDWSRDVYDSCSHGAHFFSSSQ